jgi:hypothetical protein
LHDQIKEDARGWHKELLREKINAYMDLVQKPKGKILL